MSRAENRALEAYPIKHDDSWNSHCRKLYISAYHQAEQDLELGLEDIKTIDKLLNQCVDYSNPYQEVLKRFNKERKEK